MKYFIGICIVTVAALFLLLATVGSDDQPYHEDQNNHGFIPFDMKPEHDIYAQVWSQYSPQGKSWEYKVNCGSDYVELEECFLWDLDAVEVITPSDERISLEKDFEVNEYSGEITRRWVIYGPSPAELPATGSYTFEYKRAGEVVYTHDVEYEQQNIDYPTAVEWERRGEDLYVSWQPPAQMSSDMWYKVIAWNVNDTPELSISDVFEWDAQDASLQDVPFVDGGEYEVNVAAFYPDGYAYSEYHIIAW